MNHDDCSRAGAGDCFEEETWHAPSSSSSGFAVVPQPVPLHEGDALTPRDIDRSQIAASAASSASRTTAALSSRRDPQEKELCLQG
jgi:hypothetical protein